jgi:hypothetical protein
MEDVEDLEEVLDRIRACVNFIKIEVVPDVEGTVEHAVNATSTTSEPDVQGCSVPMNYHEAHRRPDSDLWRAAEDVEYNGLESKNVFEWTRTEDVPVESKTMTSRWVYDLKVNEMNVIVKYKARIVVRGFEARAGLEYAETFSATVRATALRIMFAIAARCRYTMHQFDVEQAFLAARLKDNVVLYVHPPPGRGRKGFVWRLLSALYGLKQASHLFERHLTDILVNKLKMKRLTCEHSIYVMHRKRADGTTSTLFACVYVDDIITIKSDDVILREFQALLSAEIAIKDIGPLKYCLGILVKQDPDTFTVSLSQEGFISDLLNKVSLNGPFRSATTPLPAGLQLSLTDCPSTLEEIRDMSYAPFNTYRSIVGSLMYLTGATRPDIAFAVNLLSRYVQNPGRKHYTALLHLIRYLDGTRQLGVTYIGYGDQGRVLEQERRAGYRSTDQDRANPRLLSESFRNNLVAYCDASWGDDKDRRRSTSGWVVYLNGGPVCWRVRRQKTVATSSSEAELYSMSDVMKEVRWLQQLMNELGYPQPVVRPGLGGRTAIGTSIRNRGTIVWEDNAGAIQISQNDVFHNRTKHVDIQHHFVMDYTERGLMAVMYCPTTDMIADALTKALGGPTFLRLRPLLMGTWYLSRLAAPAVEESVSVASSEL